MKRQLHLQGGSFDYGTAIATGQVKIFVHRGFGDPDEDLVAIAKDAKAKDPNVLFLMVPPNVKLEVYEEVPAMQYAVIKALLFDLGKESDEFSPAEAIRYVAERVAKTSGVTSLDVLSSLFALSNREDPNLRPEFVRTVLGGDVDSVGALETFVSIREGELFWDGDSRVWNLTPGLVTRIARNLSAATG